MNFPIKTVIIDDDVPSVEVLAEGLKAHSDVQLAGTANDLENGLSLIQKERPDLVFLDIEFPESNALELTEKLQASGRFKVIFYSSYRKYLLKALRLQVFDSLLKPFDSADLALILHRYRLAEREGMPRYAIPRLQHSIQQEVADQKHIAVTTVTNDKVIVSANSIVYFRYDNQRKLWEAVLNNLERHILKRHTNADVILNYGPNFVRTHKSYIVNTAYLGVITQSECKLLPPLDHIKEIKISKNYRRDLLDRFYDI